jgi:hypothetical protein
MADYILKTNWSNPSTIPNNGKYAAVDDLPYTGQKFTYHRGYGNLVVHQTLPAGQLETSIVQLNRIQPLANMGSHLPPDATKELKAADTEVYANAWDSNPKYI